MAPATSRRLDASDIDRARAVAVADIAAERSFILKKCGQELCGACPKCGGTDRFSISIRKGAFLCRQCHPKGGGDAIAFVQFLDGIGFRAAVETLTGGQSAPANSPTPLTLPAKNSGDYGQRQHAKA